MIENTIIVFPTPKISPKELGQNNKKVPNVLGAVGAKVYSFLTPPSRFYIHTERMKTGDEWVEDFFTVLSEVGSVTIVNTGEEITFHSMLRVEKSPDDIYEIGVDTFIRLTEPVAGMVQKGGRADAYIIPVLDSIGIHIGMVTEAEDIFTESILIKDDLEDFHIENINAVWAEGFYSCLVNDTDNEGMIFTLDDFLVAEDIQLLHFLCHAYIGYFGKGAIIDMERIHLELASHEGIYTDTKIISIDLLRKILTQAITRKFPLYANFSPDMSIERFYLDKVFPLLSNEYLYSLGDE